MNLEETLAAYGEVFQIDLCDIPFYFRPLTRKELDVFRRSTEDGFEFEERVSKQCTLYPEQFDFQNDCKAGIPAILCLAILNCSGYGDDQAREQAMADEAMAMMQRPDCQMDALIMTAFPQYKREELQALTRKEMLELYAMARWSCENIRGVAMQGQPPQADPGIPQMQPNPRRRPPGRAGGR